MNYDSLINAIGDVQYLLTDIPHNVSVESVKLDKSGIEIILARGIEDFAEDNALELAEALIPSVSLNVSSVSDSGRPSRFQRIMASCARLTFLCGPKVPSLKPFIIPCSTQKCTPS